jgi:predicted dehydrogenase
MWGMLEFANGTVGTLETSWLIPAAAGINTDDALQITGLEGTVKIQTDSPALRIWRPNGSFAPDVDYEPDLHGSIAGALRNELAHFADSALRRMPSTVISPQEGFDAVAVTLALIRAAKVGRQLILEDELGSWM